MSDRLSLAELVACHRPNLDRDGVEVTATFPDQGPAAAFHDALKAALDGIPPHAARQVRGMAVVPGFAGGRSELVLVDGDGREHRFQLTVEDLAELRGSADPGQRRGFVADAQTDRRPGNVRLHIVRDGVHQEVRLQGCSVRIDPDGKVTRIPESPAPEVEARLTALERRVQGLIEDAPDDAVRARTAFELAYARRMNAEAEKLEREIAAEYGPPPDDGRSPVNGETWKVEGHRDRGVVWAGLTDERGRAYALLFPPDRARQFAEALLAGARHADKGPV